MSETRLPDWEHRSELTLAALPSAVTCARLLVRRSVIGWPLNDEFVATIEQITDELVVHSVATTGVTDTAPLYREAFDRLRLLFVRLRLTPIQAMVEVWDRADLPPHPRLSQSPVIQATHEWGYDLPSPGKRVVWCIVPTMPEARKGQRAELPRRVPRPIPRTEVVAPADAEPDTDLLKRVLDGLRRLELDEAQED